MEDPQAAFLGIGVFQGPDDLLDSAPGLAPMSLLEMLSPATLAQPRSTKSLLSQEVHHRRDAPGMVQVHDAVDPGGGRGGTGWG